MTTDLDDKYDILGEPRQSMKDFHAEEEREKQRVVEEVRKPKPRRMKVSWIRVEEIDGLMTAVFHRQAYRSFHPNKHKVYWPTLTSLNRLLDSNVETIVNIEGEGQRLRFELEIHPIH